MHIDGFNLLPYLMGEVETQPTARLLLLQRRRRTGRDAVRELEDRVHRAALPGHAANLGGTVHHAAGAQAVQPSHRPLRVRQHHVEHVLRLVPATTTSSSSTRRRWRRRSSTRSRSSRRDTNRPASASTKSSRTRRLPGVDYSYPAKDNSRRDCMPDSKPNILVIWGDDIGISNLSCYSRGMMGYFTPNIDRIADEGMLFTDSYGEQSCTAGRSSFITGQSVYRTGMSKVGYARHGCRPAERRPDDCRTAQADGLRHRPVREEPPRRPEQVPADRARFRRVLRQPVSPQRRGGAGERGLSHRGRGAHCCARHCYRAESFTRGPPTRTAARSTTGTAPWASSASRTPDR